jgi:CubicO group peptidase (beta-lactamase class C family)
MVRLRPNRTGRPFSDKPLDFASGEKWSYSNSGYILVAYLIEKITGEGVDLQFRGELADVRAARAVAVFILAD